LETTNSTNSTTGAANDAPPQVASTAKEQTSEAASTAMEGGRWVASVGAEEAKTVAATAADQAAQVANEVGMQARTLVDQSKQQLLTQAQTQTDQIAAKLRELGDQVQALVEGRTQDAGPVADYARQAARSASQFAGRIENRGFDGVIEDVQRFARRKPGTFLLGAALAGFGAARLLRAGAMAGSSARPQQPMGDLPMGDVPMPSYDELPLATQPPPLVDVTDSTVAAEMPRAPRDVGPIS
jgi:hypothetical protein